MRSLRPRSRYRRASDIAPIAAALLTLPPCLLPCTGLFLNPLKIMATCMVKDSEGGEDAIAYEKKFSFDKEMLADLVRPRSPYRRAFHTAALTAFSISSPYCGAFRACGRRST